MVNAMATIHPTGSPLPFFKTQSKNQNPENSLISSHFKGKAQTCRRIKDDVWIDPCCGSGGFFLAVQEFLTDPKNYTLDRPQKEFIKNQTFYGTELVRVTYKLCLMNLYLHNIGDILRQRARRPR